MIPTVRFNTRRRLAVLFFVPLAFSLLFFVVTTLSEHTDVELLQIENINSSVSLLRSLANDIESGERGYLLTGDERFLTPFQNARASLESQINTARRYAQDQPRDIQDDLVGLAGALRQRTAIAEHTVEVAQTGSRERGVELALSGEGDRAMNSIRLGINKLQSRLTTEERGLLDHQRGLNHSSFFVFLFGTAILIVVLQRLYRATVSYLDQRDSSDSRLHELNLSLEAQVEERTRDLRIVNEELQQFAYVASHDLQEPLRTITSFSQLLESRYKGQLDADADEFIGYIVVSAKRMTDLINGLLTLVRLRRAGQPVEPVSFADILKDATISLQAATRETNAQITHGDLPELVVDRVQFSQVLQNLISNAIKYRSAAAPRVHVSAVRDDSHWVFSVADNGRGFDPQFAERIFGLFQRLHNRESIEGTGMGLSIARKVVERHGGRIWAESVESKGSKFFFSLPVSLEGARHKVTSA